MRTIGHRKDRPISFSAFAELFREGARSLSDFGRGCASKVRQTPRETLIYFPLSRGERGWGEGN